MPHSLSLEYMDNNQGIKQRYPDIYDKMMTAPIHGSFFKIMENEPKVRSFSANPSDGQIGFTSYSELGHSDVVLRKILENNH